MEGEPLVEEVIPSLAEVQSSLRIALGSPSHRLWLASIGSTAETDRTYQHTDGKSYPYVQVDVSSASRSVYTGQQRQTKTEGRIANFNKRFCGFAGKP